MRKIIMKAESLEGYLTAQDTVYVQELDNLYGRATEQFKILESTASSEATQTAEKEIIALYDEMGKIQQKICKEVPQLKVYSFETEHESHAEASRVMAKLRKAETGHNEFIYYTQRAFEMLFKIAYRGSHEDSKNYLISKTPVVVPVQNYAVHKISDIDHKIENTVMCVMLRGALLPSMIMSKEIEEYSSHGYVTPFALFKIKRDDTKHLKDMQYILNLDMSYFNLEELNGKDLIFADPMNATGGSLITVVKYLERQGVKPKSISCFHVISSLKGALCAARALTNCTVYTLWMDPSLNNGAYILPGLGDAGDRLNGVDEPEHPRNMIQLIADYGATIAGLYRHQLRAIENVVLQNK
ncbi:MAG: uracil phosphoribosyltransferase [Treponema sp.]